MDKILAIIFCFLLVQTATAQEQTVSRESLLADVHGIIITAKKYSVYRHQVHWDNLENSIMVPRDLILGFKEYISVIQKLLSRSLKSHFNFR